MHLMWAAIMCAVVSYLGYQPAQHALCDNNMAPPGHMICTADNSFGL